MKLTLNVQPDEASFDQVAASRLYDQIAANPRSVIGLSTGRTTGNMHRILAGSGRRDLETVRAFHSRRFAGIGFHLIQHIILLGSGHETDEQQQRG